MVLCFLLVGSQSASGHAEETPEDVHYIHMTEAGFEPEDITIQQGDTVVFENLDERPRWPASNIHPTHTAYPGTDIRDCGGEDEGHMFDACRGMELGETFSFLFEQPGSWRFHDHNYPEYTGSITVEGVEGYVVEVEPAAPAARPWWPRLVEWVRLTSHRVYYRLFPGALDTHLTQANLFTIAQDDNELRFWLELAGADAMMEALLQQAEGGDFAKDCHQEAHQIGRVAYGVLGGAAFEQGSPDCHSGYYHGAMEAFLAEVGTENLGAKITDLCALFETSFGIFQCLHGVGHGVMAYEDYNLMAALDQCDELATSFDSTSCYGGVFMENIVAGQGLGAIPGHDTDWVREDDLHFPCNEPFVLDNQARLVECYKMQTSWMLFVNGHSYERTAAECELAPEEMVIVCFQSLGRDIAGISLRDPMVMKERCEVIEDPTHQEHCVIGALNVVVDFWGARLGNQDQEFCALLTDGVPKQRCFQLADQRRLEVFGAR